MKPCTRCNGTGQVQGFACPGFRPISIRCSDCLGEGQISADLEERKAKGEAMRADRLARDMSLKEEAKRLGISPVELSHLEHGIAEVYPSPEAHNAP